MFFLDHTATDCNLHTRILFLISMKDTESAVDTIICILTNGTGIVDDKITIFGFRWNISDLFKDATKFLRISCIHLATEGCHVESKLSSKICFFQLQKFAILIDEISLTIWFIGRDLFPFFCITHVSVHFHKLYISL